MKASRSLSPEQFSTLLSVYTFLKGVTTTLETGEPCKSLDTEAQQLLLDDLAQARSLRDFGQFCTAKLLEHFPELHEWRVTGQGGGVS
jgi:hypothetical protein